MINKFLEIAAAISKECDDGLISPEFLRKKIKDCSPNSMPKGTWREVVAFAEEELEEPILINTKNKENSDSAVWEAIAEAVPQYLGLQPVSQDNYRSVAATIFPWLTTSSFQEAVRNQNGKKTKIFYAIDGNGMANILSGTSAYQIPFKELELSDPIESK